VTDDTATPVPCAYCGDDIPPDEVMWADDEGEITLDGTGEPFHEDCLP
jgi:hypothetical protein